MTRIFDIRASFENGTEAVARDEKLNLRTPFCGNSLMQNLNCVKPILKKDYLTIMLHRDTIELIYLKRIGTEGMKKNNITLTLGQMATGGIFGLVGGWVCLFGFENFVWQVLARGSSQFTVSGRVYFCSFRWLSRMVS